MPLAKKKIRVRIINYEASRLFSSGEAEILAQRIREMTQEKGCAPTYADILEEARDPDSVFHDHFEWNDKKAAELHRIEIAKRIVKSIQVTIETTGGQRVKTRAFFSTVDRDLDELRPTRRCHDVIRVLETPVLQQQVIDQFRRIMENAIEQYQHYEKLRNSIQYVRKALQRVPKQSK